MKKPSAMTIPTQWSVFSSLKKGNHSLFRSCMEEYTKATNMDVLIKKFLSMVTDDRLKRDYILMNARRKGIESARAAAKLLEVELEEKVKVYFDLKIFRKASNADDAIPMMPQKIKMENGHTVHVPQIRFLTIR